MTAIHMDYVPSTIVWLGPVSRSVILNRGAEALRWMLRRISGLSTQRRLLIVSNFDYAPSDLRSLLNQGGVDDIGAMVKWTRSRSLVRALRECMPARSLKDRFTCVYAPLESCFAPSGCVDLMEAIHERNESRLTCLVGVPQGVSPLVLDANVLEVVEDVETLCDGRSGLWPFEIVLRECIATARRAGDGTARVVEIDASREYAGWPAAEMLPPVIELFSARLVQRLSRITSEFADSDITPAELCKRWRDEERSEARSLYWPAFKGNSLRREGGSILFVSAPSAYSGAEESLCRLARGLRALGHEMNALVGMEGIFAARLREMGVRVFVAGEDFSSPTTRSAQLIAEVLDKTEPTIVHINCYSGPMIAAMAKLRGAALVYHVRVPQISPEIADTITAADAVIAVSDYARRRVLSAATVSPEVVSVVYDGVSCELWRPVKPSERVAARRHLGLPVGSVVVLMVARFEWQKRHDILIQAIAAQPANQDIRLVLVGESFGSGDCERAVDECLARTGLAARTLKLGFQESIRDIQQVADICVLCSEQESLGTSILEAMAMGLPVIVSDDGGLREIVSCEGRNAGIVVPAGDVSALAKALARMIGDAELRKRMGADGRAICLEKCSVEVASNAVSAIYRRLCESSRTR